VCNVVVICVPISFLSFSGRRYSTRRQSVHCEYVFCWRHLCTCGEEFGITRGGKWTTQVLSHYPILYRARYRSLCPKDFDLNNYHCKLSTQVEQFSMPSELFWHIFDILSIYLNGIEFAGLELSEGWGWTPRGLNTQFLSTDAHFWVKIGFKCQSLGKISNISAADPPVLLGQFQHWEFVAECCPAAWLAPSSLAVPAVVTGRS